MTQQENRFLLDKIAYDFEELRCTCMSFGVEIMSVTDNGEGYNVREWHWRGCEDWSR